MRGFGITGVDFAIEAHMDKVAEAVGMNPIELRILNAYRDGDMKAHRRLAKNCALIECCQVVAEKAGVKLSPEMLAPPRLTTGGGGERAQLPARTRHRRGPAASRLRRPSYARKGGRARPTPTPPARRLPRRPRNPGHSPPRASRADAPASAARPRRHRRNPGPPPGHDALLLPFRLPEALTWPCTAAAALRRSTTRSA
jgi:hypothetical protein